MLIVSECDLKLIYNRFGEEVIFLKIKSRFLLRWISLNDPINSVGKIHIISTISLL